MLLHVFRQSSKPLSLLEMPPIYLGPKSELPKWNLQRKNTDSKKKTVQTTHSSKINKSTPTN